jgi:predicted RNA-binding Zn-ribbon protein involved in translation (DUF1610 family)
MPVCYFCGKEVKVEGKVFRKDTCPNCGRDLHACVQCRFYDPSAHNSCREPLAERVVEKEKANLCGYFEFAGRAGEGRHESDAQKARKALDDLFKKK